MDPALTKRLDEAFKKSLEDPQVIASFEKYDQPVIYMGSDEYARFAQRTYASEKRLIEKLGLAKAI
jgi:tripartite-type tricarboxylate transporter receptor subunit TctC